MKILLVGAGAVGSVLTRYLSRDDEITEVICGSNDLKSAKEFITENSKTKLVRLDASNIQNIVNAARGRDLIINASPARFNENIMEAALKVGVNYQDLASEFPYSRIPEQLKFHKRFQKRKLVGLVNTGAAPGVTNLLAREAADKLDRVDTIHLRLVEDQKADEFIFAWSRETTFDVLTSPPLVYKNGKFIFTKPFGDAEEYDFPHPFGRRRAFSIYGDEVATIPLFIKVKNVDFKSSGSDIELPMALSRLGLLSAKPILVNGKKVIPLEVFKKIAPKIPSPVKMKLLIKSGIIKNAFLVLTAEAIGKKQGKDAKIKMSAIFPSLKQTPKEFMGATYVSYPTATAAYSFLKIIPHMKSAGVFFPEALDAQIRKEVMLNLKRNGVIISRQFKKK